MLAAPIPTRSQRFPYEKPMTTDLSSATVVHPIIKYADSGRTLVRILVVDDHDGMRAAVITKLQSRQDFEICGEASNGEEAVQKAILLRKGTPDFRGGGEAIFPRHHDVENYHVRKQQKDFLNSLFAV